MAAQAGQLLPLLPAVGRPEQTSVFHPGVDRVRVIQRWLEMPDPRELPRVRRAVIPLVRTGDAIIIKLFTHRLPGRAAVIGALDQLAEPAAGLGRVQPVRVDGRALDMVNLPAPEVGAADVPPLALAFRRQDERALARANQYPYSAHLYSLPACRDATATQAASHDHARNHACTAIH